MSTIMGGFEIIMGRTGILIKRRLDLHLSSFL